MLAVRFEIRIGRNVFGAYLGTAWRTRSRLSGVLRLWGTISAAQSIEVNYTISNFHFNLHSSNKIILRSHPNRLHNESKCGTVRSYSCGECDSKFISRNTLNAHMLIHSGEKKHLCDFCGKSFLSRGQLQVHERCHTGEKPFKCDVCDKAFSHRESLVTHSSVHTGVKPYVCEFCDSRFSCIGNLIKHRRARPQTCGLPQYSSNSKCAPRPSSKRAFIIFFFLFQVETDFESPI